MKRLYEFPKFTLIKLSFEDILRTSPSDNSNSNPINELEPDWGN